MKQIAILASLFAVIGVGAAYADSVIFTWDPSKTGPALAGAGSSVTADAIDTTTYLHSVNQSNGSFAEEFFLQVTGFELSGQPVTAPGLNSSYGLYFAINATGTPAFTSLDISLMGDPGNNDGRPGSTLSGVSFSNGTAGDLLLGSGVLVSAALSLDAAGVRHAQFLDAFTPVSGQAEFFGNASPLLEVLLTTPPINFMAFPQANGSTINVVKGGTGKVDFVPEPASLVLLGGGLVAVFLIRRARLSSERNIRNEAGAGYLQES